MKDILGFERDGPYVNRVVFLSNNLYLFNIYTEKKIIFIQLGIREMNMVYSDSDLTLMGFFPAVPVQLSKIIRFCLLVCYYIFWKYLYFIF